MSEEEFEEAAFFLILAFVAAVIFLIFGT